MTSLAEPPVRQAGAAAGPPPMTAGQPLAAAAARPLLQVSTRVRPAPPLEPPFDDEGADWPPLQLLPGGLDDALPFEEDEPPLSLDPLQRSLLPDPRRWAAQFVRAVLEVRAARRPVQQLMPWTTTSVYCGLSNDLPLRRPAPAPAVRSIHVTRPSEAVAEVCAVVAAAGRSRAVAARLAFADGRWRCTALHIG